MARWRSLGMVAIAIAGLLISLDLAAFQLGLAGPPWEPLFGDGSRRVLTSGLARSLPIPDAAVGAAAYLVEALMGIALLRRPGGLIGTANALASIASIGAVIGAVLVGDQLLVVGAACSLCLTSAALSWVLAATAIVDAHERRLGRPSGGHDPGGGRRNRRSTDRSKEPMSS